MQIRKRIKCRLPIEAVMQQQNAVWENMQCNNKLLVIGESYFLPAMFDYFVAKEWDHRHDIKRYCAEKLNFQNIL